MDFQLSVAINHELGHNWVTGLKGGLSTRKNHSEMFLPLPGIAKWEHNSGVCRVLRLIMGSHASDIMFGHRLGEHRVWRETRETKVIDCFTLRALAAGVVGSRGLQLGTQYSLCSTWAGQFRLT